MLASFWKIEVQRVFDDFRFHHMLTALVHTTGTGIQCRSLSELLKANAQDKSLENELVHVEAVVPGCGSAREADRVKRGSGAPGL